MRSKYTITFLSDWQISSGLGDGFLADSQLCRDAAGFLYIPGRAVKGALREGAHRLGMARPDLALCETIFFGSRSKGEGFNKSGVLTVSSAYLPKDLLVALEGISSAERAQFLRDLTVLRAQTALENGTVKNASLRTTECGIAGTSFEGTVEFSAYLFEASGYACPAEDWLTQYMHAVCAATKSMGSGRSRGLGTCRITLEQAGSRGVTLPAPLPEPTARRA